MLFLIFACSLLSHLIFIFACPFLTYSGIHVLIILPLRFIIISFSSSLSSSYSYSLVLFFYLQVASSMLLIIFILVLLYPLLLFYGLNFCLLGHCFAKKQASIFSIVFERLTEQTSSFNSFNSLYYASS